MNETNYIEANRENNEYAIVERYLFGVRQLIEKLNKRAARLGVASSSRLTAPRPATARRVRRALSPCGASMRSEARSRRDGG